MDETLKWYLISSNWPIYLMFFIGFSSGVVTALFAAYHLRRKELEEAFRLIKKLRGKKDGGIGAGTRDRLANWNSSSPSGSSSRLSSW